MCALLLVVILANLLCFRNIWFRAGHYMLFKAYQGQRCTLFETGVQQAGIEYVSQQSLEWK